MKLAIYGYGNIGKGVEKVVSQNPDMELTGIYTRRDPSTIISLCDTPVYSAADIEAHAADIDVLIICAGSATDLPGMTPMLAEKFNVVDSFDNHAHIPEHYARVDEAALKGNHTALISGGWDPGMFSIARLYSMSVLPEGKNYTFWGRGVSQGHSDAIRRIPGVADARQYTVPIESALEAVRSGSNPELTTREKHLRECYVVAEEGADKEWIAEQIKTMPNYFADYDTTVEFITAEEMKANHSNMPHGGFVITSGKTGLSGEHTQTIEYKLTLDSNPEFTACALVALARAVDRHYMKGDYGCKTIFDMAPADLSMLSREEMLAHML